LNARANRHYSSEIPIDFGGFLIIIIVSRSLYLTRGCACTSCLYCCARLLLRFIYYIVFFPFVLAMWCWHFRRQTYNNILIQCPNIINDWPAETSRGLHSTILHYYYKMSYIEAAVSEAEAFLLLCCSARYFNILLYVIWSFTGNFRMNRNPTTYTLYHHFWDHMFKGDGLVWCFFFF